MVYIYMKLSVSLDFFLQQSNYAKLVGVVC